jgi:transcriptional regulator with XRE-family HTH domain
VTLGPTASTGLPALDAVLGGLFLGDNVVLEPDPGVETSPFYAAISGEEGYNSRFAVAFSRTFDVPGFTRVDARGRDIDELYDELVRMSVATGPGDLFLFDDLAHAVAAWGVDPARRFFGRTCPALLRLGSVAYWTLGAAAMPLRDHVHRVTQCVIALDERRIVVTKAEGRPAGTAGTVLRYRLDGGRLELTDAPPAARLGAGLTALRAQRGLTQSQLARIAGVSPSAMSQAERGQRGLSLATLVDISNRLGVSLDDLVRGNTDPGYELRRRLAPHAGGASREALIDASSAPVRIHEFRLDPGARGNPPRGAKGTEVVLLGQGLLQLELASGAAPVIREGEAVVATRYGVRAWENIGDDAALGFWLVV